ncbi:MAG: hypothetical protein BRD21_02530 [Halobacteriales archaeon SW_8_66_22]|nr:MAG: hypothetical protein BRC87_06950 [Halobacteriales archaeon QS_4_66_20]PSQ63459.1 MAG: hypothetical protein BRD21_02530 [Halobacteriales archaeon SW_8_66_22]
MRIELRVCYHCLRGEHENEHKTAVTRDLVACAEVVKEHKDVIDLEDVHIRKVKEDEGDDGRPTALPAVAATIQNEGVAVSDTQLITMGENGYMLVYPNPQDALKVLAGNIDEISKVTRSDILPDLSPEGAEILSGAPLGGGPEAEHGGNPGAAHGGPAGGPGAGGPAQSQSDTDSAADDGPNTQ